jgi:hypothetical protein
LMKSAKRKRCSTLSKPCKPATCRISAMPHQAGELGPGWPDSANFCRFWPSFTLASYSKLWKVAHIFGRLFFRGKSSVSVLTKCGLGYILCDFSANSSGHPDWASSQTGCCIQHKATACFSPNPTGGQIITFVS